MGCLSFNGALCPKSHLTVGLSFIFLNVAVTRAGHVDRTQSCSCNYLPKNVLVQVLSQPAPKPTAGIARTSAFARGAPSGCDDGTVIDLMVVYTPDARIAAGGTANIEMQINTSVTTTNLAFSNSLINTSVNLVHTEEVAYPETGNSNLDGPRLLNPNDGFLDNVHTLRDQHSADIVALWVETLETGGRVFAPLNPSGTGGFHEMRRDNWNGITMAHELGHNLGCAHDRPNAFPDNYFSYSYGYQEPGGTFQTIMSVGLPFNLTIVNFANPAVNHMGLPTGVPIGQPDETDCATTINQTRHIVANYRVAPVSGLPTVLFVDASAAPGGDGLGWATAFNDLQDALCQAARAQGDVEQVWVAAGTYTPDQGTGLRQMSFRLQSELAIYGGFTGTETTVGQRDPVINVTRLSGDIGTPIITADNSMHVVVAKNVDGSAVLDGFTICDGNADTQNHFFADVGGGLRCESATPVIANCAFESNSARAGAGVHNEATSPTITGCTFDSNTATSGAGMGNYNGSAPTVTDCRFTHNDASFVGGAMHNDNSSPIVNMCRFDNNDAEFGGAIEHFNSIAQYNSCTFGPDNCAVFAGGGVHNNASDPGFTHCNFVGNSADFGAGMRNLDSCPSVLSCSFDSNTANSGAGMWNDAPSDPTLTGCAFLGNMVANGGGAMTNAGPALTSLQSCNFSGNSAGFGGAVYCFDGSDVIIRQCNFVGNSADNGGALYASNASPVIDGSCFRQNNAVAAFGGGGAILNIAGANSLIVNCAFIGNIANWSGGAIENSGSNATLTGCAFSGNRADGSHGGAISNVADSSPTMTNLTLSRNHAGSAGGGIASASTMSPTLTNSILWDNDAPFGNTESQQIHHFNGTTIVNHSTVQGWSGALGGIGNNGSDPLLADPDGLDNVVGTKDDDLRLNSGSPCIDAGDNTAVPSDTADIDLDRDLAERTPFDLDNDPRFVDDPATTDTGVSDPPDYPSVVDRGAYEFQVPVLCATCSGDVDGDNAVNGNDIELFVDCFLSGPTIGPTCPCADLDNNSSIDPTDVELFVSELLFPTGCP